jgi:hypothetical protein
MKIDETQEMVAELETRDQEVFDGAIRIAQNLWTKAKEKMEFPPSGDLMDGVEADIQLAKVLNSCLTSSSHE